MVKKASKKAYHLVKEVLKKQKENESVATPKKQMFGDFEYCQVKRRIKLISYHGKEKELAVPESIDHKKVTMIGKGAFKGNKYLEKVILPESIKTLGAEAFADCKELQYVYLPVDLEVINAHCFLNCTKLEEIQIPYEIRKICRGAFQNCEKLSVMKSYVKSGISSVREVRKDIIDYELPIQLEFIGEEAFSGCKSLKAISIPYAVTSIGKRTFYECQALENVTFHNLLTKIGEEALAGCCSLKKVRISESVTSIGTDVFKGTDIQVIGEEGSPIYQYAVEQGIKVKALPKKMKALSSMMQPTRDGEEYRCFYTKEELESIEEKCELRPAVSYTVQRKTGKEVVYDSRYTLEHGIYKKKKQRQKDHALIYMTGDLMCKQKHQNYANRDGVYDFRDAFQYVKEILKDGDFVIGNMESMVSPSLPYTCEEMYINGRPYLNAPEEFLHAVKEAGFDAVVNAQNHVYDAGTRGILETLEVLNRNQLMHTGAFAGKEDKRFLSVDINGIRIAVVAYFDGARQLMKKANFTEYGKDTLVNIYDREKVKQDIRMAKEEGAEFIIAYCHWGREYTNELTRRQINFAKEVADAGADYILGAHSHCLQPYQVIVAEDGRQVPTLYSAGNFLSEIAISPQITRDTLIASLELERNDEGKVVIKKEGYYPCRILRDEKVRGEFVIVPTNMEWKGTKRNQALEEAERRIDQAVGVQYAKLAKRKGIEKEQWIRSEKDPFTIKEPLLIRVEEEKEQTGTRYVYNEKSRCYEEENDLETKEAVLVCAGQIPYDTGLGNHARFGSVYNFRPYFELMKKCFEKADFSIGNLTTMICEDYLTTDKLDSEYSRNPYYTNGRKEYLDALKYAGFDCLAMAHPNNLDTGVNGLYKTINNIEKSGMLSVGIGERKNKIFRVNGILVGVLSYTLDCFGWYRYISGEGADCLLNLYSEERAKRDIAELKNEGADFVLVYVNCGSEKEKIALKGRKEVAMEIADNGADYIICTIPNRVSKYYRYQTKDGRSVPIATSIGTLVSGKASEEENLSVLLKIVLYKKPDGKIDLQDKYIPIKQFDMLEELPLPAVPALSCYYKRYDVKKFPRVKKRLGESLGNQITVSDERVVRLKTKNRPQLTYQEVYDLLGAEPSRSDWERIKLEKKAPMIAARRDELTEGCVAILVNHYGYKKAEYQITMKDAIKAKAALVISQKPCKEIPTILVPNCKTACKKLYRAIKAKYNPITVTVTGTAGKTTTKELMSCVFDTHYKTLHVEGNNNTFYTVGTTVQKLRKEDEAYIQEAHGGSKYSARNISNVIQPDIAIITNIGEGHLMDMGTIENVIQGKLEIVSGLKDTGVLVVNDDNQYLKDLELPGVRILRYSTHNQKCDYYAQNIESAGEDIKFQIVCKEGCFDAVLHLQGTHNVENALGVFACAMEAGIPPYKIIAGLTHYIPEADKQNLMEYQGYHMLVDTYSATPLSVEAAVKTLSMFPREDGSRKIAVLGDIPALGDASEEKHKEVGKRIAQYDFDLMLCIGSEAKYFALAAIKEGKKAYYYEEDREAFNRKLTESIRPGDLILFKSGTRSHLKEETIYPLFGIIDKK